MADSTPLQRFFPPPGERRQLPGTRVWKILLRTAHLMTISVLVGGALFSASHASLRPWLYATVATGVGMAIFEAYPSWNFLFEGWGLLLIAKLALLASIPFARAWRFPILLAVVAIAGIGSHLPRRFRHYSLLHRKVMR